MFQWSGWPATNASVTSRLERAVAINRRDNGDFLRAGDKGSDMAPNAGRMASDTSVKLTLVDVKLTLTIGFHSICIQIAG